MQILPKPHLCPINHVGIFISPGVNYNPVDLVLVYKINLPHIEVKSISLCTRSVREISTSAPVSCPS